LRALECVAGARRLRKTSLLAWPRARDERPFAWVSLDAGDNDPVALVAAVLAALDQVLGLADALGGAQAVRERRSRSSSCRRPGARASTEDARSCSCSCLTIITR
jgi:hypothetical protein